MLNAKGARSYLSALTRHNVGYAERDDDDGEYVIVDITKGEDSHQILTLFDKDEPNLMAHYCFGAYEADMSDDGTYMRVLSAVNDINKLATWSRFMVNRDEGRVDCAYEGTYGDSSVSEEAAGEIIYQSMRNMDEMCFRALEYLRSVLEK